MRCIMDTLHDAKALGIFEDELDSMVDREMVEPKVDATGALLDLQRRQCRIAILDDEARKCIAQELGAISGLCDRESESLDGRPFCDLDLSKHGGECGTSADDRMRERDGNGWRRRWRC